MENTMKVVIFHVNVPKREDLSKRKPSFDIYSNPITINTGTKNESKWRILCNFNTKLKETDPLGLEFP